MLWKALQWLGVLLLALRSLRQSLFSLFQWLAAWKLCSLPTQAVHPSLCLLYSQRIKRQRKVLTAVHVPLWIEFISLILPLCRDLSAPSLRKIAALREMPLYFPTIFWRFLEKREFPHLGSNAVLDIQHATLWIFKQRSEEKIWMSVGALQLSCTSLNSNSVEKQL